MSWWRRHISENPMTVELQIARRKMMPSNMKSQAVASYVVVGIIYLGLAYIVIQAASAIDPSFLFYPMLILSLFVVPVVLHGCLAGERQARSLEMLYAAPISPSQIVAGKMLRAVPAFLGVVVSCAFLMFVVAVVRPFQDDGFFAPDPYPLWGYGLAIMTVVSTTFFVAAAAAWVSSRAKTTGAALLGTVGFLVGVFVVLPVFGTAIEFAIDQTGSGTIFLTNPIGMLNVPNQMRWSDTPTSDATVAWVAVFVYFAAGVMLLVSTVRRLNKERVEGGDGS